MARAIFKHMCSRVSKLPFLVVGHKTIVEFGRRKPLSVFLLPVFHERPLGVDAGEEELLVVEGHDEPHLFVPLHDFSWARQRSFPNTGPLRRA